MRVVDVKLVDALCVVLKVRLGGAGSQGQSDGVLFCSEM